jgi:hypothetical protein
MKGIIFAGCSFTWGQGLYFYSDFDDVIKSGDNNFKPENITDAHFKFKNILYFPRLVSNHFNTFEIVKKTNGGSDENSINFVNNLFKNNSDNFNGNFEYGDFDYLILQTSQIGRNKFNFTYKGIEYSINVPINGSVWNSEEEKLLLEWFVENGLNYNEWFNLFIKQIFEKIKNFLIFYESVGIKTKILCWHDELLPLIKNDEFVSKRFVPLVYENKKYECISYLVNTQKGMLISNDFNNLTDPPMDNHPSRKCHQIIANNIINSIETNLTDKIKKII